MFYKATLSSLSMLQYFYSAAQGPGGVSSIWGLQNMVPFSLTRKNIAHSCVQNPDFHPQVHPSTQSQRALRSPRGVQRRRTRGPRSRGRSSFMSTTTSSRRATSFPPLPCDSWTDAANTAPTVPEREAKFRSTVRSWTDRGIPPPPPPSPQSS